MKPGYYWVNYHGEWMPAQYSSYGYWIVIGYDGSVDSEDVEVGEEIIRCGS